MEQFSIDLKASDKGERKKVVKYLRRKGLKVRKRKEEADEFRDGRFLSCYSGNVQKYNKTDHTPLVLPSDWDKLVKIIEGEKPIEEEFKVGDWIVFEGGCIPIRRIASINGDTGKDDDNESIYLGGKKYNLATPSEVQSFLESSLKERGFNHKCNIVGVRPTKKGDKWVSAFKETMVESSDAIGKSGEFGDTFSYNKNTDTLYNFGRGLFVVYEKGVFATLKDTTPSIGSYTLKQSGSTWSFGCKTFDQETLERIIHLGVTSIEVEGNTITLSQLKDILKYIKN